jgi:peptidylprolyl isomerase
MPRQALLRAAALAVCAALAGAGCGSSSGEQASEKQPESPTTLVPASRHEPKVPLPKGTPPNHLVVKDLKKGIGEEAKPGDILVTKLVAHYVTGEPLESSWAKGGKSFIFQLGHEEANPGWEKGVPGMRVGGRRLLIVPPDEGSRFGTVGEGKPEDTLVYVVELVAVMPKQLKTRTEPKVVPPKGPAPDELVVHDLIQGEGMAAEDGDLLTVQYVGIYYDGRHFTNSWKRTKQFHFKLGAHSYKANPGWEKGLKGMRIGERRELIIPPKLEYQSGAPEGSKPSDTLVYVVDLIGITGPEAQKQSSEAEASPSGSG